MPLTLPHFLWGHSLASFSPRSLPGQSQGAFSPSLDKYLLGEHGPTTNNGTMTRLVMTTVSASTVRAPTFPAPGTRLTGILNPSNHPAHAHPILQRRKPRLHKVRSFAHGHAANKRRRWARTRVCQDDSRAPALLAEGRSWAGGSSAVTKGPRGHHQVNLCIQKLGGALRHHPGNNGKLRPGEGRPSLETAWGAGVRALPRWAPLTLRQSSWACGTPVPSISWRMLLKRATPYWSS